jgi:diguanylate cyclase (GGDEF)-like protein
MASMHISDLNQLPATEIAAEMAMAHQEKRSSFYFPHRLASGETRQVEVYSGPLEVDGQAFLYSFVHDITERVLAQQRLASLLAEQRAILNSEIIGIVKLKNRSFVWMNKAFATMLGYHMEELVGKPTRLIYPDDASHEALALAAYPAMADTAVFRTQAQFMRKDGRLAWFDISGELLPPEGEEAIWSFIDITERKQIEDQVRHLAFHDGLTKLPNRRLLVDRMGRTMAASKRNSRYAALMFLDLDNFKPLNDLHGHDMGDLLLIEVAERLRECVRAIDTVARFGGDEFVVMLSDLDTDQEASVNQATAVAEKIRASLAEPYQLNSGSSGFAGEVVTHRCTASIGVALFNGQQDTEEDVLNRADAAMYAAKHAGRNQVRFDQGNLPTSALQKFP